jgi:hypothetical protein
MGAESFINTAAGKTAQEAFDAITHQARYNYGHAGYTGTIAEKHEFVMIDVPEGLDPVLYAQQLIEDDDGRIDDKWGPAGCIDVGGGTYLFFGWASS